MTQTLAVDLYTRARPLYEAASSIGFKQRFDTLLANYPRIEARIGQDKYTVPLERKIEIVSEVSNAAAMPMKYNKTQGGFWALKKPYRRRDINTTIEMRQWVNVFFSVNKDKEYFGHGGPLNKIWDVLRVLAGEAKDLFPPAEPAPVPWCFDEQALYQVLREQFALMVELQQLLPEGSIEGWQKRMP